jgi:lipopolysaccharide exporter
VAAPERRNTAVRDFATLVAGTGVGPVLALAVSPVLTRLFTPAEIGEFAVFVALLGIEVVVCLGYDRAVLLPRELQSRLDVLMVAIVASFACGLVAAIVLVAFAPRIAEFMGRTELGVTVYLLPAALFASGCLQALTGWCIATRNLGRVGGARFIQALTVVVGQVSWGAAGGSAIGLAAAHCLGLGAGAVAIVPEVRKAARAGSARPHAAGMGAAIRRYRSFTISSGGALMNAVTLQLPILVLSARFGIATAGLIGLAQRVGGGTVSLLVTSASQVFASRVIEPIRAGNRQEVARIYRKVVMLQALAVLPGLLLLPFAPAVFAFVFGDQWREAGVILQILSAALAAQFIFSPVYGVLNLLERQGVHLIVESARLATLAAALLLSAQQGASVRTVLAYVAAAYVLGYVVAGAAAFFAISHMRIEGGRS